VEDAADDEQHKEVQAAVSSAALQQLSSRLSELDAGFGALGGADESTPPERQPKKPRGKKKKISRNSAGGRRPQSSPGSHAGEMTALEKSISTTPGKVRGSCSDLTVATSTPRRDAQRAARRLQVQQRCARIAQQSIQMSPRALEAQAAAATSSAETETPQSVAVALTDHYHKSGDLIAGDLVAQVRTLRGKEPLGHHDGVVVPSVEAAPLNSSTVPRASPRASPRAPDQRSPTAWSQGPHRTELTDSTTSGKGTRVVPKVAHGARFLRPTRSAQGRMEEQTAAARAVATKQKQAQRRLLTAAERGRARGAGKGDATRDAQQSGPSPRAKDRSRRLRSPARQMEHVSRLSEPKNVRTRSPRANAATTASQKSFVLSTGSQAQQPTPQSHRLSPFSSLDDERQEQATTTRQLSARRQALQVVAKERDITAVRLMMSNHLTVYVPTCQHFSKSVFCCRRSYRST
jgi:hypothetical protein